MDPSGSLWAHHSWNKFRNILRVGCSVLRPRLTKGGPEKFLESEWNKFRNIPRVGCSLLRPRLTKGGPGKFLEGSQREGVVNF